MRFLRFLPFPPRKRRSPPTGILPLDPREEELLARQRAARGIHEPTNRKRDRDHQ